MSILDLIGYTPGGYVLQHYGELTQDSGQYPPATVEDLNAITTYMEELRAKSTEFPALLTIISDYEKWLSNLGWWDKQSLGNLNQTVANAKYFRDSANKVMGQELPKDWVPADATRAAATVATKPSWWSQVPTSYKLAAGGAVGLTVLALIGRSYLRTVLPRKLP